MPEMPEVETVRRGLAPRLSGKTIVAVDVRLPRLIKNCDRETFAAELEGAAIVELRRAGKGLILELSGERALAIHLRMTGRLYLRSAQEEEGKAVRIVLTLDSGERLIYADVRTLGTLHLVKLAELASVSYLAKLGPEPLSAAFSLAYLRKTLAANRGRIKGFLLDQSKIAGLGNIYVDEALHRARIHPCRPTADVTDAESARLFAAINEIIQTAIDNRGTTFRDYVDGEGKKGNNQQFLAVYGRTDEPCPDCGTMVRKIVAAGRGTHFCPRCQPETGARNA